MFNFLPISLFLFQALVEEGEDPENYVFDKFEFDKSLVSEKKDIKIVSTDKKPTTPTKTVKTNVIGRRPGPKSSKFCLLVEKN